MVIGRPIRARGMDEVIVATQIMFVLGLVGFGVWFSRLTFKLDQALDDIQGSDDQLAEIREAVEVVATILNRLPELLPQFHMNTNPLQPIFEAFAQKLSGQIPLKTVGPAQGPDGRYNGPQTQTENNPPTSEAYVESDASS